MASANSCASEGKAARGGGEEDRCEEERRSKLLGQGRKREVEEEDSTRGEGWMTKGKEEMSSAQGSLTC
eukprot:752710-Hanusia_phi.AAC.3